ncbi:hypothetical protein BH11PLA2_BH11PLA2_32170 [soil metagenome]
MIAVDSDILTLVAHGHPGTLVQWNAVTPADRGLPVVVADEATRGRLSLIRQAEAAQAKISLPRAYALFQETLDMIAQLVSLPYTDAAESLFQQWRQAKIRIGTNDLRVAAVAVANNAKLVTRNARVLQQVPGLQLEIWS